jgi:hypothetical protein
MGVGDRQPFQNIIITILNHFMLTLQGINTKYYWKKKRREEGGEGPSKRFNKGEKG